MKKKIASLGVAAVIGAGFVATAGTASAHTTGLTWGCGANGMTTFVVKTWHRVEPLYSDSALVVDGVAHPFSSMTYTPPTLTDASGVVLYDGYISPYDASAIVSLPLSPGKHTVSTTGWTTTAWEFGGPITITTPACGVQTVADLSTLTAQLSKNPFVTLLAQSILAKAGTSAASQTAALNSYLLLMHNAAVTSAFSPADVSTLIAGANSLLSL